MKNHIPKEKVTLTAKIEREVEAFLAAGGTIQKIPFGVLTQPAGFKQKPHTPLRVVGHNGAPQLHISHRWRSPLP